MAYEKILIVSGGSIADEFAGNWIKEYQPDYLLVADSGMEFMRREGLVPDKIIGDFDSVGPDTLAYFKEIPGIAWTELNPVKDDTDTEFAIRQAIELGAKEITVLGATGTRLDHVMGNIALLGIGLSAGVSIRLVDGHNRIRMINRSMKIRKSEQFGAYVSLLPYTKEVTHLSLKGFKYSLEDFTMKPFSSLGISNEIVEEEGEIIFQDGILLVIEARDEIK